MANPLRRPGGPPDPPRVDPRRPHGPGFLGWLGRIAVGAVVLGLSGWVVLFYLMAPGLPDPGELRRQSRQATITVLAADGSVLARRGAEGARFVELAEISPNLVRAVIATEDARFYGHFGLDVFGLGRAVVANVRAGGVVEGGSTITQQLAKNLYLNNERSLRRKLEELVYAVWLETQLSKDEILTLYLNRVYFGAGATGVEAAAQRYFGKPAKDLGLQEAAMVAGLLKAPSRLAPTNDLDLARDRAAIVLARMVDVGFVTEQQALAARARPAKLAPDGQTALAGHFVDWTLDGLKRQLGPATRDTVVRTTLDPAIQKAAEAAVARFVDAKMAARGATQAAVVVLDKGGAVRAMVGGTDYRQSAFNRAVEAKRQPGSAFKPFVYLAALSEGIEPERVFTDKPVKIGSWEPRNYTGKYVGEVTMAEAFAQSINTVTVLVSERVGRQDVIEMARRCGIASAMEPLPSLPLGTFEVSLVELAGAYQPIAAGGLRRPIHAVEEVAAEGGYGGRTSYRHEGTAVRVVEASTAAEMQQLMVAAVDHGTGKAARLGDRLAGGKTGTTQYARDAWFLGYSGDYVAGVWVGNDEGKPMKGVSGSTLPAQIWREVMLATPKPAPVVAQVQPRPRDLSSGKAAGAAAEAARDGLGWLLDTVEKTFGRLTQ